MKTTRYITAVLSIFLLSHCSGQELIQPAAERFEVYLPQLKGKRLGIVANQTSMCGDVHLIDSLNSLGGNVAMILKVFSPEHGFRGEVEYGELIDDGVDSRTGLPVISLYGKNRKPSSFDLENLDLLIFDIQDVGARFYTYISTLYYVMQACAENDLELLVLDRPNPNGFYVDGPVLDPEFSSFVGMHEVPVVYGMTIGEYGQMINGEGWLGDGLTCTMQVIPCSNYTHSSRYELPVSPSPNLPNMNSVYLYPSICFFEGTVISEGRGTLFPFEVFGHPDLKGMDFSFIPQSIPGAASNPKQEGRLCYGMDLRYMRDSGKQDGHINLAWLIRAYQNFPDKDNFFIPYFENIAGNGRLRQQIIEGLTENEIRASWADDLNAFREIRQKYLIYPEYTLSRD